MSCTKTSIGKGELIKLIESDFESDLTHDFYEVETKKAVNLLTHTRLDIAFKLLYLEMKDKGVKFSEKIYKEHIRAFSLGKFTEPGNKDKNSIEKFLKEFDKIFNSIKSIGFDNNKTLIPLSENGSIANGSHRVACAIYLNKDVDCVKAKTSNLCYDYNFFYNRNISNEMLDIVVTKFVEYAQNVHIALIWPVAQGFDKKVEAIIPNLVYKKEVKLGLNGAHNLLSQIYYGENWIGGVENNFSGAQRKLVECFKTSDSVRVIAFQAENLEKVVQTKEKIREVFGIGKHSVHMTDTKEEAIRVSRVVFNDNSIHFLNYAKPNKYISTHKKITTFKKFIFKNKLNANDLVLDGSMILSVYGLREANDIDYFLNDNKKIKCIDAELECHDEELKHHDAKKNNLIYNAKKYFYFDGLKFVSFGQLYKMKKNRAEGKDLNDCKIMEALMEKKSFKGLIGKLKQNIYYKALKITIDTLHITRLYTPVQKIYRKYNNK